MAFFDEIGKKLNVAGQEAAQQAKNFTDVTKLNSKISEKERKINQLYALIGQHYYENHRDDASSEEPQLIYEISVLINEIYQCREEIRQIKGIQQCQNCGAEVPSASVFCNNCGARVVSEIQNTATSNNTDVMMCPNCNAVVKSGSAFCTKCGAKFN